ncbi:MAG: ATP-binding protein [Mycobacteriales bacterium]
MSCQHVLREALPPGDSLRTCHHLHLDPLPQLVTEARSFVREHAPPLPEETAHVLLLLTSELVTNAVLHARTAIEVGIAIAEHSVVVTVHDQDLPARQWPYDGREGGWGLGLVAALAPSSAMSPHPGGGKTAWFLLPRGELAVGEAGSAARPGQGGSG